MHRLDSRFRGNDAGRRYRHITWNRTRSEGLFSSTRFICGDAYLHTSARMQGWVAQ
jgi:hypothetical protein